MPQGLFTFDDFRAMPVSDSPDNTAWILYDPKMGAFILDAGARSRKGRVAAIISATRSPAYDPFVDSTLHVARKAKRHLTARLPKDAPKGGPALLAAALQSLRDGFNPPPLRLREGRSRAELEATMKGLAILGRERQLRVCFDYITCDGTPDTPICEIARPAYESETGPEFAIPTDVKIWFAPLCSLPTDAAQALGRKESNGALLMVRIGPPDVSSHDLMEAAEAVMSFYRKAAKDLGLDGAALKARLDALGLWPETPPLDPNDE